MRTFLFLFISIIFYSCNQLKSPVTEENKFNNSEYNQLYLVTEIDSINDWNVIYATRKDKIFKIAVKKDTLKKCKRIKVGESYGFKLHSRRTNAPTINGVKISTNSLKVNCFSYDKETDICIEPEKGIYELYYADNIKGLCLIEN